MPLVKLKNISRIYGGVIKALDDISFSVGQGEMVALLGASGSGKSTLLNIIAGFEVPTSGTINVAGMPIDEQPSDKFRQQTIGFLFQQFNLLEHLSAVRNVELALFPTIQQAQKRHRISCELLQQVGLGERLYQKAALLSGGERQRVAFCRSIANRPKLLLADEPTGNLDKASSKNLLSILTRYIKENKGTLIVATHDDDVAAICQRTICLEDGKVIIQ